MTSTIGLNKNGGPRGSEQASAGVGGTTHIGSKGRSKERFSSPDPTKLDEVEVAPSVALRRRLSRHQENNEKLNSNWHCWNLVRGGAKPKFHVCDGFGCHPETFTLHSW
jgi:hypothetical protein